jgi:hypothetical protein
VDERELSPQFWRRYPESLQTTADGRRYGCHAGGPVPLTQVGGTSATCKTSCPEDRLDGPASESDAPAQLEPRPSGKGVVRSPLPLGSGLLPQARSMPLGARRATPQVSCSIMIELPFSPEGR